MAQKGCDWHIGNTIRYDRSFKEQLKLPAGRFELSSSVANVCRVHASNPSLETMSFAATGYRWVVHTTAQGS